MVPGIDQTTVENGKLVTYNKAEHKQEAEKSTKNLKMIVRDKYKAPKPKSEKIKARLVVAEPRELLATPEGSRWSLVDWFKSTPDCLPGIQNMTQLKHDIEYEYKENEIVLANLTMNKPEEILNLYSGHSLSSSW